MPPNGKPYALNLFNNVIYTHTAQGCGGNPNMVYAYDLATKKVGTWGPAGGGMWGRTGPAISSNGMMYTGTGDGRWDPENGIYGNGIIGVKQDPQTKALRLEDYYGPSNAEWLVKRDLDMQVTPAIFNYKGKELMVDAGKECRLYLMDTESIGGDDHRTPLYRTPLICNEDVNFASAGIWGSLASWEDAKGTRWVLTPIWGPKHPQFKAPIENGEVKDGAIVAFKVEEKGGKLQLTPAWISRDMNRAEPPVIANGVVFAYGSGEDTDQAYPDVGLDDAADAPHSRDRRRRCCMRWTRRPARSCGTAAIRSHRGITGAGSPWPTAGSTSAPSTTPCTASASRSSRLRSRCGCLGAAACFAQTCVRRRRIELERSLDAQRRLLTDWAGLTHYGSDNAELRAAQGGRESRGVPGRRGHGAVGRRQAPFFPGKPYLNRGIARQTIAADAGALPAGRDRAEAEGGDDSGGHERSGGLYGPATEGDDRGQFHVDGGYREGQRHPCGAGLGDAGLRLLQQADGLAAAGKDHRPQRLDQGYAARSGAVYLDYYGALADGRNFEEGADGGRSAAERRGLWRDGAAWRRRRSRRRSRNEVFDLEGRFRDAKTVGVTHLFRLHPGE